MNYTTGRWLARFGALIIVAGFFLPAIAVSCTVMPDTSLLPGISSLSKLGTWSITLNQIAQGGQQPLLYLVPLGAVAVLVLTFLAGRNYSEVQTFLWGQAAGLAGGVVGVLIALISIYSQTQSGLLSSAFTVSPDVGFYVLCVGYAVAAVGIVRQFSESGLRVVPSAPLYDYLEPPRRQDYPQPRSPDVDGGIPVARKRPMAPAWLVTRDGRNHQLCQGMTTIGRSSRNDVAISGDTTMSREHAKIIEENGHYRLVDLGSKSGTRVNGRLVREPVLLESDDEVQFGDGVVARFVTAHR